MFMAFLLTIKLGPAEIYLYINQGTNEPPRDSTNKMTVRPAKT